MRSLTKFSTFSSNRRSCLKGTLGLSALALPGSKLWARTVENAPVSMIVPFPAGGSVDAQVRLVSKELSNIINRPVVVENRAGASASIGTRFLARAKPDGRTLGFGGQGTVITNNVLFKNYKEDVSEKLTPIHGLSATPVILACKASLPYKTLGDFVAFAKENPRVVNMASNGLGTGAWQIYCYFRELAGFETTDIQYSGAAPGIRDLLAGTVDVISDYYATLSPHIDSGAVRPLAISYGTRLPQAPEIPTFVEQGYEQLDISTWSGIFAPKGMTSDLIAEYSRSLSKVIGSEAFAETLAQQGSVPLKDYDYKVFSEFIKSETVRWTELAHKAGLQSIEEVK